MGKNFYLTILLLIMSSVAIAQQPQSPEIQSFRTAKGIYEDGLYKLAADQFASFIADYPKSDLVPEAQFYLAESYFQLKKYDRAIFYYEKLLQTDAAVRFHSLIQLRYGESYFHQGNFRKAKGVLSQFISQFPEGEQLEDGYYWLAESEYRLSQFNDALRHYNELLNLFPTGKYADFAQYSIAYIQEGKKQYKNAVASYRQLLSRYPKS